MRLEAVMPPDLGAGPDKVIIISHWFASRGDEVWEGERLVEIRVGPATFDVPAPASGCLNEIRVIEDERVLPGSVLGYIGVGGDRDLASEDDDDRDGDRRNGQPPSKRRSS